MCIMFMYPPSPYLNHSMFKHYTYLAETVELVSRVHPDIVVMDCAVEMKSRNEIYDAFGECDLLAVLIEPYNIQMALSLAEIYKDTHPGGKTVFFGTAAVLVPNHLSHYEQVDCVIANGNFARGILDAAELWDSSKRISRPMFPESERQWGCSLDAAVPMERYRHFGGNMFEFTVQVGCPFHCSFCSEKLLFPRKGDFLFAQRPVEDVLSILKRVKDDFSSVYFSATTLTYDRDWIGEVCEEMVRSNCILPWRSDTRVDCLDPELLEIMKRSGLRQLSLGVESFSDNLLSSVNKRQNAATVYDQIVMCKECGVDVKALLILGLPGQSARDVLDTQRIVEELGIAYRWKEYSPIRELHMADHRGEDVSQLIDSFNRTSFRSDSIPGLSPEKYMSLLFPKGYIR